MIGIEEIGIYIPDYRQMNGLKSYQGEKVDPDFIKNKVGFVSTARKAEGENTADMCQKAFHNLLSRVGDLDVNDIECICVCTQNGEYRMPHTSAILQDRLSLSGRCAAFDISLACSGYIYGLGAIQSFMEFNNFSKGLLFTCDPYSKILDTEDKGTDLLFGDAATVTLLSTKGSLKMGKSTFYTKGASYDVAITHEGGHLLVDNRKIFNFVLREGMDTIQRCMKSNQITDKDVDVYLFHQASKYVLDQLGRRMNIASEKVPFKAQTYGNTVSSSLPLMLQDYLEDDGIHSFFMCAFGAGLSAAATVLNRA